jgi:hypothetical protein
MAKTRLKLVARPTVKRTVTPTRRPNSELRPREHLTEREVEKMIQAAKGNRWGQRDSTMLLMAFRHGYGIPMSLFMNCSANQPATPPMMMAAIQPTCASSMARLLKHSPRPL